MIILAILYVAVSVSANWEGKVHKIHARESVNQGKDIDMENWGGYHEGDRYFYFPGEDGKIHKVDTKRSVHKGKDIDVKNWGGYHEGDRYFYFPGEDGKVHKVDAKEPVDKDHIRNFTGDPNNIGYWLYTRSNPKKKQILKMGDKKSVRRSNFKAQKVTVFIVHGWIGNGYTESSQFVKEAFVKNTNMNIIVVDWSTMADQGYCTAKAAVAKVGKMVGQFISWLSHNFKMELKRVHLVGHSLGGHLVGNTGKALEGKVGRITGLDPAAPLWYLDDNRLAKTNGRFVEVIHTNAFLAGYPFASGHSDHYPNGGASMPGCLLFLNLSCNHARSWKYMAASIENNNFCALKCHNWEEVLLNSCTGSHGYMGNSDIKKKQSGLYRVNTMSEYPYV